MPKFIHLTQAANNSYHTVYINCDTIEAVFTNGDGAHITFAGKENDYLDVVESAKTVVARIELAEE